MDDFGADSRSRASTEPASGLRPTGFDRGEDAARARIAKAERWRPALIAFYKKDGCEQKSLNLKNGDPLDYLDFRTIEALEAAFIHAAIAA